MKHIVSFFQKKFIENICQKYDIKNYTINDDMSIDIDGGVYLKYKKLSKLPIKFRNVSGWFHCSHNDLKTLKGSPIFIGSSFTCNVNLLKSLKYCPKYIGYDFDFTDNNIYTVDSIVNVSGIIDHRGNPIVGVISLFDNFIITYLEYLKEYRFQPPDTNVIYKTRLKDALSDYNNTNISDIVLPKLKNYIYQ